MKTRILFLMALAASVSAFGADEVLDVQSGSANKSLYIGAATTKLIKIGSGTAIVVGREDNGNFTGPIEVQEGTLSVAAISLKTFGKPSSVTVSNGATFDITKGTDVGYFRNKGTRLYIEGSGVDGKGAIVGVGNGNPIFGTLNLTGDASVGSSGAKPFAFKGASYELGSHVLQKVGLQTLQFWGGTFNASSGGGLKVSKGRVDFVDTTTKFSGSSENVLEICGGATNNFAMLSYGEPSPWTLKFTGTTVATLLNTYNSSTATRTSYNNWAGPLTVNAPVDVRMSYDNNAITFSGPVTTSERMTMANKGELIFTGDGNKTFGGNLNVSGGRIEFNGTKNVNLDGNENRVSGASSVLAFIDAGIVSNKNYNLAVYGSTVDNASRMIISGKTTFPVTTAQIGEASGYGNDKRYGIVEVGAGAEVYNALGLGEDGYEIMSVYQRDGYWLLPSGGGNKNARAPIGHSSMGYYELSGGKFRTFGGTGALTVGNNGVNANDVAGEGAFAMSGGVFNSGVLTVGASGDGTFYQTGGTATLAKSKAKDEVEELLVAGTGSGFGQVTLSGETAVMNLGNGAYGSEVSFGSASGASTAVLNLNDGASLVYYKLHKKADAADGSKFYLNFNGGILKPGNCWQAIGADYGDKQTAAQKPDAVTIYEGGLNIDISKALNGSGNPDTTFIDCDLTAPAGGSIVSIEIPDSLKSVRYIHRPRVYIEGDGYGASAVADFDSAAGRVKGIIVTSPGFGYTAANTTCKIASNSFQKQADRLSNATACTVTVGTVRGGGVRMVGAGNRLVLSGKNSYAGVTVCENGSIKFNSAAAHPDGSGLAVWKGKDINSYIKLPGATPVNAGSLAGDGRLVCGNVAGVTNVVADAAKLFADGATPLTVDDHDEDDKLQSGCGNVTLAANAKVTVTGMRELVDAAGGAEAFAQAMTGKKLLVAKAGLTGTIASVELPGLTAEEAKFFKASVSGNAVKFGKNFGTVIILR